MENCLSTRWWVEKNYCSGISNIATDSGYSLDINKYLNVLEKKHKDAIKKLNENPVSKNECKITHKIWLNKPCSFNFPTAEMVDRVKLMYRELPDYHHVIWVNNDEMGEKLIDLLSGDNYSVSYKNVEELSDNECYNGANAFLQCDCWALASDIFRVLIVYKYGGVYSDFGWIIKKKAIDTMNIFDFALNGEGLEYSKKDQGVASHNVIYASKPNNNIIEKLIADSIKLKHAGLLWHEACGPRNMMASLTFFENESYCLLKCSDSNVIDRHHTNSHKTGMFGTALFSEKKYMILDIISKTWK